MIKMMLSDCFNEIIAEKADLYTPKECVPKK